MKRKGGGLWALLAEINRERVLPIYIVLALALPGTVVFAEAESPQSGGIVEPSTTSGSVETPAYAELDHLLRGQPSPRWSKVVRSMYFNPVPGPGVGCVPVGCASNSSICESMGCSCRPTGPRDDGMDGECG